MRFPLILLLLLFSGVASAEELQVVLWNGEQLFNTEAVKARADDLRSFGAAFKEADIIFIDEVCSIEVVNAARDAMGFAGYHTICSDFNPDDDDTFNSFEVGLISRFPLTNVIEFDPSPDNSGKPHQPKEQKLFQVRLPGLESLPVSRGFLAADAPALGLTLMITHLKSSRGAIGVRDLTNAMRREQVAAAMAQFAADKLRANTTATVLIAGDMNVGETDREKNGQRLTEDRFDPKEGDPYDDTHAMFTSGVVAGLQMASLTKALGAETYASDDFPGVGPIDCMYVAGYQSGDFTLAKKTDRTFGSDHYAVFTRFLFSGSPPPPGGPVQQSTANSTGPVRIVGLLPIPPKGSPELVILHNTGDEPINLSGWRLQDRAKHQVKLNGELAAGQRKTITLFPRQMPLNNSGDSVELLDAERKVVHKVTYDQAETGRVIVIDVEE